MISFFIIYRYFIMSSAESKKNANILVLFCFDFFKIF